MPRIANRFTNPANGIFYDWPINHSEEEGFEKARNIEHGAPTGTVGLIKQQTDDAPMVLRLSGTILEEAQLLNFILWYATCETHTIYFRDFAGDEYEVLITKFNAPRRRVVDNPRDRTNAPYWIWRYTIEMEVLKMRSGPWVWVTP